MEATEAETAMLKEKERAFRSILKDGKGEPAKGQRTVRGSRRARSWSQLWEGSRPDTAPRCPVMSSAGTVVGWGQRMLHFGKRDI